MIARIKAFVAQHWVQSAVRHAATAFVGAVTVAVLAGGIHAVTTVVLIGAAGAAARVLELAVVNRIAKVYHWNKGRKAAVQAEIDAAVAAAVAGASNRGAV